MAKFSYLTVVKKASGLYKEKGSKFFSFVFPVLSEDEVKGCLDALRKEYHDARHHCYAWRIGTDKSQSKVSDDGEPNHSAGDPILGQIRSKNLTNVLVVVIRYFGGTKLGVSGLIGAYRTATLEALNNAGIIEKEITQELTIKYPYTYTPEVMRLVKDFDLNILAQSFLEECSLNASIKLKHKEKFLDRIALFGATGTLLEIKMLNISL